MSDTDLVNTGFMHNLENLENKPFFEKLRENPQILYKKNHQPRKSIRNLGSDREIALCNVIF